MVGAVQHNTTQSQIKKISIQSADSR